MWFGTCRIHAIVWAFRNFVIIQIPIIICLVCVDALFVWALCRSVLCQVFHGVAQSSNLKLTKGQYLENIRNSPIIECKLPESVSSRSTRHLKQCHRQVTRLEFRTKTVEHKLIVKFRKSTLETSIVILPGARRSSLCAKPPWNNRIDSDGNCYWINIWPDQPKSATEISACSKSSTSVVSLVSRHASKQDSGLVFDW